jgi:hypothetical protein
MGNLLIGKNNQDSFLWHQDAGLTVAVVADGCGSKPRSEVGSNLGSQLLVPSLVRQCKRYAAAIQAHGLAAALPMVLEGARQDVLSHLRILSQAIAGDGSFSKAVTDNFLFTLVGAIISEHGAGFFSIGDGVIVVNGDVTKLGPFKSNEPPYISYALYPSRWKDEELRFVVHRTIELNSLYHFMIGSDGVGQLADAGEMTLPGKAEKIGPLSDFWTDDRYFTKTGIRKRLLLIQSQHCKAESGDLVVEPPRLPDDTTVIVGRRRKQATSEATA